MTASPTRASSDVVVIGAGLMGSLVALRLAQRGARVTVIERGIAGAEASSAAAGILGPQMESDKPNPVFDLGLRSRAAYPALAVELREATGIDIGFVRCGVLALAFDDAAATALQARLAWQRERNLAALWLEGAAAREREPALAPAVRAAVAFPDDAQVDARALARAASRAAAVAGARFLEGRYVRGVHVTEGRCDGVELDGEVLPAAQVVVAAGSWSSLVEGVALPAGAVRPARGQMVQIETRPPLLSHIVYQPGQGYLVPRRDGTILAGSTMELAGFRKEVTVGGLAAILGLAQRLVPALEAAPVTGSWANFRPYTEDHLPILGRCGVQGVVLATGHFRNGILLAPVTADAIAELVVTGASTVDLSPFSVDRWNRSTP